MKCLISKATFWFYVLHLNFSKTPFHFQLSFMFYLEIFILSKVPEFLPLVNFAAPIWDGIASQKNCRLLKNLLPRKISPCIILVEQFTSSFYIYAETRTTKIKHQLHLQLQLRKQFDINYNRLNELTLLSRRNFKFQRFKLNRFRADKL